MKVNELYEANVMWKSNSELDLFDGYNLIGSFKTPKICLDYGERKVQFFGNSFILLKEVESND